MTSCVGFVDAGYLKVAGARTLGVSANQLWPVTEAIVSWLRHLADQVHPITEGEVAKLLVARSAADRTQREPASV